MMAKILRGYLQWFFRVSALCGWAVFIKLQTTVFPAVRFPEDILLFINGSTFSGYFLLLFIIMFILWSTSVQFMCAVFYYFGTIYVDLLFAILSIYLRYIILLLLILKIFSPQGLNLLFQINCKNISCNGFQRNVNARN